MRSEVEQRWVLGGASVECQAPLPRVIMTSLVYSILKHAAATALRQSGRVQVLVPVPFHDYDQDEVERFRSDNPNVDVKVLPERGTRYRHVAVAYRT